MPYPIYTVDAFTDKIFGGNPAACCSLSEFLPDTVMQKLANENNLSETAFFVKNPDNSYQLRWFTPEVEMDLAGHPTLATAFVIFNVLGHHSDTIQFHTKSGVLSVTKNGEWLVMNFPSRMPLACEIPEALLKGFSIPPVKILKSRDYFLVYESQEDIEKVIPNFIFLNKLDSLGIIITAKGNESDFVCRFLVPNSVIGEDPVTGSAHATLIPYWANELNKTELTSIQLSKRKGHIWCGYKGDRVTISGRAVLYMKGEYYL